MKPGMQALMIVGAALYVICPLDLDFIPFFGWIDDAIVVWLTFRQLQAENAPPKPEVVLDGEVVEP